MKKYFTLRLGIIFFALGMMLGLVLTACSSTGTETPPYRGVRTQLLVKAPEGPLPLNKPVVVKSYTEDARYCVSHVELYVVQLPSGETDLLIRSDVAPFKQTAFTTSQMFVPTQKGHYVIKVVGYNKLGEKSESEYIGFDVE